MFDQHCPSLLDRLCPAGHRAGGGQHRAHSRLIESVRLDLEMLLNTRTHHYSIPAALKHVQQSVANYGLIDITAWPLHNEQQRRDFACLLAATITRFESRLRNVVVTAASDARQRCRFRIEAVLVADPMPGRICFDSMLEHASASLRVTQVYP